MRRPHRKQEPMTTLLLKAIKTCRRTPYKLAMESCINATLIYEFVKGKRSLTLTNADRLVNALNLELSASVKAPHE